MPAASRACVRRGIAWGRFACDLPTLGPGTKPGLMRGLVGGLCDRLEDLKRVHIAELEAGMTGSRDFGQTGQTPWQVRVLPLSTNSHENNSISCAADQWRFCDQGVATCKDSVPLDWW